MSASPRIYVDFDDVICQTAAAFLDLLRREFGRDVRFDDITSFDLGRSFGLGPAELQEFLRSAHEPEVLASMEPVDGAVEALGSWRQAGYEVAVVTGRPPSSEESTRRWLDRARVPYDSLTFVDKYSRADPTWHGRPALSLEDLKALDFCLAIEDSLKMARYLADHLETDVSLLDRPWNREPAEPGSPRNGRIVRCRDWAEVVERFPRP